MITIAGTCHVFNLRGKVKSLIKSYSPDAVCVELDEKRLERLRNKRFFPIGLFSLIQKLIAMRYGTQPGNDMLGAVEGAEEIGTPYFLIDKNIDSVVPKLQGALIKEFINPLELLRKLFVSMSISRNQLPALYNRDAIELLVYDFEHNPEKYRSQFEQLFPFMKKILLDEREEHMSREIRKLHERYENIFVVVGAGHVSGLERSLFDLEVHLVKLLQPKARAVP